MINNAYKEQACSFSSLYDYCNQALDEMDFYEVSPDVQPAKDELKLYIQDLKWSAYYYEIAARSFDEKAKGEAMRSGDKYYKSAGEYIYNYFELLYPGVHAKASSTTPVTPRPTLTSTPTPTKSSHSPTFTPTSIPTPSAPGFGAVFAFCSLLGSSYLARRRRG